MMGEGLHFSAFHCFSSTLITKREMSVLQCISVLVIVN